jgi:hypothetical protein
MLNANVRKNERARGRFLSSLPGLVQFGGATYRGKRWAMVGRPCRDCGGDGTDARIGALVMRARSELPECGCGFVLHNAGGEMERGNAKG